MQNEKLENITNQRKYFARNALRVLAAKTWLRVYRRHRVSFLFNCFLKQVNTFSKTFNNYFMYGLECSDAFSIIFWCSKNHHEEILKKKVNMSIFMIFNICFKRFVNILLYSLFSHLEFFESLYEPSRQWRGWQLTGGPELTHWRPKVNGRPKNWLANCFVVRFVLDSLVVHHDTLRYSGTYRLMLFESQMK